MKLYTGKRRRVLLAAVLFLLNMSISAQAATDIYTNGNFHYVIENGGITIVEYFGSGKEVNVPESIAGYPVSAIGTGSFPEGTSVTKVNLPDTIMTIEEGAIAAGIEVVYNSNTDAAAPDGGSTETEEPTEGNERETTKPEAQETEAAKPEAQGTEAAKPEVQRTEAAKPEVQGTDAPKPEAQGTEAAKPEVQGADAPKPEAGKTELSDAGHQTSTEQKQTEKQKQTSDTAGSSSSERGAGEAEVSLDDILENLSVNEKGNLVVVDRQGKEKVLDDSQTYTTEENADGTVWILFGLLMAVIFVAIAAACRKYRHPS